MRFIKEIPNDFCQASLYNFNNKYIIKFEAGLMEQTYKVSEMDLTGIDDIEALLNNEFLNKVKGIFESMSKAFSDSFFEI